MVAGAVPRSEPKRPFRALDDMRGQVQVLDDAPGGDDRLFEVDLALPADGGEVGSPPLRQEAAGKVRVRYRRAGSKAERQARQAEDVTVIRLALHGGDWRTPSTGIDCLACVDAPPRTQVVRPDGEPAVFEVIEIGFTVIYREAST